MIRPTGDAGNQPVDAGDARHHADGDPSGLEHRPLFDVQLDVAVQVAAPTRLSQSLGPAADRGEGRTEGASVRTDKGEVGVLEGPGYGAAPHAAQAEVVRLLAEEVDDDEVVGEQDAGLAQQRTASMAPSTPMMPSKRPPPWTVSVCEPVTMAPGSLRVPGSVPIRLAAASVLTLRPASSSARHPLARRRGHMGRRQAASSPVPAGRGQTTTPQVAGHPGEVGRGRRAHEEDELG